MAISPHNIQQTADGSNGGRRKKSDGEGEWWCCLLAGCFRRCSLPPLPSLSSILSPPPLFSLLMMFACVCELLSFLQVLCFKKGSAPKEVEVERGAPVTRLFEETGLLDAKGARAILVRAT